MSTGALNGAFAERFRIMEMSNGSKHHKNASSNKIMMGMAKIVFVIIVRYSYIVS